MEFNDAIKYMEHGYKIRRPNWEGYLFLDVDNRVKHAGNEDKNESFWDLDILESDWEIKRMDGLLEDKVDFGSEEITESRLEALMDENSSHIKRLYYLEEIIEGQHKAFKRIADTVNDQQQHIESCLSKTVKEIPKIKEDIANIKLNSVEFSKSIKNIEKILEKHFNNEKKVIKNKDNNDKVQQENKKLSKKEIEEKEFNEIKEKISKRKDIKSKWVKPRKKV